MATFQQTFGVSIEPASLKLECAACGRSAHLDNLKLCDQCRDEYDQEARDLKEQTGKEDRQP